MAEIKNTKINVEDTEQVEWNDVTITVKKVLTPQEMTLFVDTVSNACFDEVTGEYQPDIKDIITKYSTVKFYSDVTPGEDDIAAVVYGTNLVDVILSSCSMEQYIAMLDAIDAKLEYICNARAVELEKKFNQLMDQVEELLNSFEKMFGGLDPEKMMQSIDAFASKSPELAALIDKLNVKAGD